MIYDNSGSEIFDVLPQVHVITTSDKLLVGKVFVFKEVCKNPSSLAFIKFIGLNILMTEKTIQNAKISIQTTILNNR